jgi:toxin ParE1/3/4
MPGARPPRPSSNPRLAGLRAWPVKGSDEFWTYYVVDPEQLVVVRVLHSKRDIGRLLDGEGVAEQ